MNKVVKIISILMVAVMLMAVATPVLATTFDTNLLNEVESKAGEKDTTNASAGLAQMAGKVIRIIRNIAVIGGVILLSVLGIKYMMGSAEEKSGYQKSFVPLVVGIVVVAAATQIATMLFGLFE